MKKEEVLKDIDELEREIGKCICDLVEARLHKNRNAEIEFTEKLAGLAVKAQQVLSLLYDYINNIEYDSRSDK